MILTCGEAVIDMIPTPDGTGQMRTLTGGAAVNTAIALARLGRPVGFWGGLSSDAHGEMLQDALRREGVDISRAPVLNAPTPVASVRLVNGHPQFELQDADNATSNTNAACLPSLDDIAALVLGGLSLIHRPGAGAFEAVMQLAGPDRLTLLDPNIRPALVGADPSGYRARLARMIAMADILKLSDEDIAWLHPDPPNTLLTGRACVVVYSHGAGGVTVFTRHGSQTIPAPRVTVTDTVGAGDTFNAGFLAGLAQAGCLGPRALALAGPDTIHAAATLGVQAATLSVTRAGATPPYRKDLP